MRADVRQVCLFTVSGRLITDDEIDLGQVHACVSLLVKICCAFAVESIPLKRLKMTYFHFSK